MKRGKFKITFPQEQTHRNFVLCVEIPTGKNGIFMVRAFLPFPPLYFLYCHKAAKISIQIGKMKIAESDFWTSSKMQVRTIIIIINYNYYPYN